MTQIKINSITIRGFRGIKEPFELPLKGQSVLLYGDNGTGKSSVADGLEWFYNDEVKHLSGEEIDRRALRNFHIKDSEESSIFLEFSDTKLNTGKTLSLKKDKLITSLSNDSIEFKEYYTESRKENLILRYRNLEDFLKGSKLDKLKYLSEIIGFGEVTKVKEVIKKSANSLKTEIKSKGFENQEQAQIKILMDKLGTTVYTESQLFETLNTLIASLKTGIVISSFADIDAVISKIKKPIDTKLVSELSLLQKCSDTFKILQSEVSLIDEEYTRFYDEFETLYKDIESIKQTLFEELLNAGKNLVTNKIYTVDECPLCLQPKDKAELLKSIEDRINNILTSSKKLDTFKTKRDNIKTIIEERIKRLDLLLGEPMIRDGSLDTIKGTLVGLRSKLMTYLAEINLKLLSGKLVKTSSELIINENDFIVEPSIEDQALQVKNKIGDTSSSEILVKIEFSKTAFTTLLNLRKEKQLLDSQKDSIIIIYNEFVKKQKEGLESFLQSLSSVINEFYQFMNPGESFQDIEIIPIEDEDELKGITVQYKFYGEVVSPPQKYFSESHVNCYGLAFFLASVKAFNHINKIIVLDDVISSFDSNHRLRFANLLTEKFGDYQIILLTHEKEWFTYIKELVKRKNWIIHEVKWNNDKGAYLEKSPAELRELIQYQIANNIEAQLGNSIRQYLEYTLKRICYELEVKTSFKFNDLNEKRMSDELLNTLKSSINRKSTELTAHLVEIDRVANSAILGNLLSHDNQFEPKIGDLKAFWADIEILEKLFYCEEKGCKRPISLKYYDTVTSRVRCKCGKLNYDWRK